MNVKDMSFVDIMQRTRGHISVPKRLLAFDPGETIGVCLLDELKIKKLQQIEIIKSNNIGLRLVQLFDESQPDFVCLENYRVYGTHAKQHINAELFTPQLIGRIKQLCEERGIPYSVMMAAQSKAFVTDDRLVQWGFVKETTHEFRHAIDSLRVALTHLLFGS